MDTAGWNSYVPERLEDDLSFNVASLDNQDGQGSYQIRYSQAPLMDRSNLSGSSLQSNQSFNSNEEQTYVGSPHTPFDTPQSEVNPPPQFDQMSLETVKPSQGGAGRPFLFDIEKYGDPRISWRLYYEFKVTKNEAYLELQPGYLPTLNYPARIMSEKVMKTGEKVHRCLHLNCTAKPFTRHYDLERHVRTHRADGSQVNCDYPKCPHKVAFRKDHCREHFREYHNEDVVKRGAPKNTKSKEGQKQPETIEEFMSNRMEHMNLAWWRCTKCIIRVQVEEHSYICPECKQPCEPIRVTFREIARRVARGEIMSPCGQCENMWVANANDPDDWAPCPRCRQDGQ